MQYNQLKHLLVTGTASDGSETVTVPEWLFRNLLMASLRSKAHFDEAFYLSSNADIRSALKRGEITSAEEHYYITGYFESSPAKEVFCRRAILHRSKPRHRRSHAARHSQKRAAAF